MRVSPVVLRLDGLEDAKRRYEEDFATDAGVINLLRQSYLRGESFLDIFTKYQESRREPGSHRYESLIALMLITIVGTVAAGIILEHYKENKKQIQSLLTRLAKGASEFSSSQAARAERDLPASDFDQMLRESRFCTTNPTRILQDTDVLLDCLCLRRMLQTQLISHQEYLALVTSKIRSVPHSSTTLSRKAETFIGEQRRSQRGLRTDTIALAIDGYCKGVVRDLLLENEVQPRLPKNVDKARLMQGLGASPGAVIGVARRITDPPPSIKGPTVLIMRDRDLNGKEAHEAIYESQAVVTVGCGITGHVPVVCRGMGRGCVIVSVDEFSSIETGDRIGICGSTGVVGLGLLVR